MRIRFGHFNIKDLTAAKLRDPGHPQVLAASSIIGKFRPDILSLNEIEARPEAPQLFMENFLLNCDDPLLYDYHYMAHTNSGVPTGLPHPYEQKGFGLFEGQYGISLYSRFPIITGEVRSFEGFPWSALPAGLSCLGEGIGWLPGGFPLFSTNLTDIPISIGGGVVHVVLLHASIPVKGPFNRERNGDQLVFLNEYISGRQLPGVEPFSAHEPFVMMGDLNADPERGGGMKSSIRRLLANQALNGIVPEQPTFLEGGGVDEPYLKREGFSLRLDYILPSRAFYVQEYEVFRPDGPLWWKIARRASDHFFVYADCDIF